MRPIVLEILSKTPLNDHLNLVCYLKLNLECFRDSIWLIWELLKVRLGWAGFLSFLLKNTYCTSLVRSALNIMIWY